MSGLFLRKLIPIFTPVHCPDLKLFKQRQKKWQCLVHQEFTPLKCNLTFQTGAKQVLFLPVAFGACCVPSPSLAEGAQGCLAGSWGSITVLLPRHQALKKMLMNPEIPFALQTIQFVLPLFGINWSCCCFVPIVHVNNAAVRWLSMVKILVTNQAREIKNILC